MASLNTGWLKSAILAALNAAPSGKTASELAVVVGRDRSAISSRLHELLDTGRAAMYVVDGGRRVWFAPQHAETARAAAEREGWKFSSGVKRPRRTTVAAALAPTPMKPGSGPRITIAPPFVDRRFAVDNPAPVFSGLPPGKYPLHTGSAIAQAYGEGKA